MSLCFTDPMPTPLWYDAPWRMQEAELPLYTELLEGLKRGYADKIALRIGLEADYHPGTGRFVARILTRYPWDYVIGSVHYLGARGPDNPAYASAFEARELASIYRERLEFRAGKARAIALGSAALPSAAARQP